VGVNWKGVDCLPSWTEQSIAERVLATDVTAIVVLNEHGALMYANEMASQMLGLHLPAPGSSNAAPPEQSTNPESPEHLQQLPEEFASFRWIACTDAPLRDVRLALDLPHLGPRLFSINASPLPSKAVEPDCVVLSIHDFTEQYRYYEEALQKSEERLKLATEAAGIGIWERDLLNDTFHWDERMCAIYGYRPDQSPNDYPQWRQMVLEEDIPDIERAFRQALENRSRFETEFRIRSYDGSIRYLRGFGQYIYDHGGQAVKLVGVNEDITGRKSVERELA
jgi:PAS domain S-box-containing protein